MSNNVLRHVLKQALLQQRLTTAIPQPVRPARSHVVADGAQLGPVSRRG